ncbi:hypothetical protein ACP70R_019720 [Stipagrostis hirtigluma subsp. patula]
MARPQRGRGPPCGASGLRAHRAAAHRRRRLLPSSVDHTKQQRAVSDRARPRGLVGHSDSEAVNLLAATHCGGIVGAGADGEVHVGSLPGVVHLQQRRRQSRDNGGNRPKSATGITRSIAFYESYITYSVHTHL